MAKRSTDTEVPKKKRQSKKTDGKEKTKKAKTVKKEPKEKNEELTEVVHAEETEKENVAPNTEGKDVAQDDAAAVKTEEPKQSNEGQAEEQQKKDVQVDKKFNIFQRLYRYVWNGMEID